MGDVVLGELWSDKGLLPQLPSGVEDVVFGFGEAERAAAVRVAERLRREGRRVELVLGSPRLKRVMFETAGEIARHPAMCNNCHRSLPNPDDL